MRTKEYRISWTRYSERNKYSGEAMVFAENKKCAEAKFFRTRLEINPAKDIMVGYIINKVREA